MSSGISQKSTKTNWSYTWESQSHSSTLRLLIFNSYNNPRLECQHLQIKLLLEQSSILMTWVSDNDVIESTSVPVPSRVLLDVEAPLSFKTADDHIEIKLVLLLPVDHPIVLNFDEGDDMQQSLDVSSDISALSIGKVVDFYRRNCPGKLTVNPISCFEEMLSVDWRESADNWFGGCCCSFDGVSEKLVAGYACSYSSVMGKCLVNSTFVVLCKDDVLNCLVPDGESCVKDENDNVNVTCERNGHSPPKFDAKSVASKYLNGEFTSLGPVDKIAIVEQTCHNLSSHCSLMNGHEKLTELQQCSGRKHIVDVDLHTAEGSHSDLLCITPECCSEGEELDGNFTLDQKFFLNGLLEDIFMIRSSHLSKVVEWNEVMCLCPKCSSLLGAYPSSSNSYEPLDGGIRFFKCRISTSLQCHHPSNVFRKYTLERMFTNQLLASANDELMFRTLVRDLRSKAPALQIVMLNQNSWSYSGCCSDIKEPGSNIEMYPVMKVLFSHSNDTNEFQIRQMENWVKNSDADEVHMFTEQIRELINLLEAGNTSLPSSRSSLQGLPLSSLRI